MTKYVNKVYNENGKDIGMIISVYQQGNQWIANVTNDMIDHWVEHRLHYSITTKKEVLEWAIEYADGRKFEMMW